MININYIGTWTLFKKETLRFLKVYNQTLVAPIVNGLLLLAIFKLSVGNRLEFVGTVPFGQFMASGLIMMTVLQQTFANTSSSIIMGKVIGFIVDFLMPPLRTTELIFAMTMASVLRGFMIAVIATASIWIFIPLQIHSLPIFLFYIFFSSLLMSSLGLIAGVYAETFDQTAAITSYIITPLSFLSGTFYSIKNLPEFWQHVAHYNPFFYMIDGFRYSMTGYSDGNIAIGMSVIIFLNIILWAISHLMISRGYRLKQ